MRELSTYHANLKGRIAPDLLVTYRVGVAEDGSDLDALREVIERRCYRKARAGFDVEPGEKWLDLGANIGAFAVYCGLRGAKEWVGYEPEPECFKILGKNLPYDWPSFNMAVSSSKAKHLSFSTSPNPDNCYRGTILPVARYSEHGSVKNHWAGKLKAQKFDGVKMDIEGAEGPIIDEWLLPKCRKLVMEYHTSRNSSVSALDRRLMILKQHFSHVKYPKAYDDVIHSGETSYRPRFDQLIFCWNDA